jgi:hypothetical protein
MISYDPTVIRTFAQQLYDRASTIVIVNTLIGILIGGTIGKFVFGNGGLLMLAAAGGGIGFFLGMQKAFILKLQAQTSLCQVQIEENTRPSAVSTSTLPRPSPASTEVRVFTTPTAAPPPAGPMGTCPNCTSVIPLASEECPKCKAVFGPGSAWKIRPN